MLISFDQKEYQKLNDKSYQLEKRRLQIELLKLQEDVIKNKRRICIVLEGETLQEKALPINFLLNT
jgi:polyphosphate kinase 2 (PPK2 family)